MGECQNIAGLVCPLGLACKGRNDPVACRLVASMTRTVPRKDHRLRVGLCFPGLGLGGAESHQLAVVQSVDPEEIVWVGGVGVEGRANCNPSVARTLGQYMPIGYGIEAARRLASECDVLVTWAAIDYSPILKGLDQRSRIVYINHFETRWDNLLTRLLHGVADQVVAVSELAAAVVPPEFKTSTIWNAVEEPKMRVSRSREAMRSSWGVPRDALVAGYLGRYDLKHKGIGVLPDLARALPEPWHVVSVGRGHDGSEFRRLCAGVERLHVQDADPHAGDVMNAYEVLVVPSRFESFGLVMAEGLWSGTPVISTPTGIAKMVPGLTRTVPIGSAASEWKDAILADWLDADGREARVNRGLVFSRVRLGLSRFGKEWTDLLLEVSRDRRINNRVERPKGCGCGSRPRIGDQSNR